jgi:hypothetical protein
MNVLSRTPGGGAIVEVRGNSLGDTAPPGHRLILKEVSGRPEDGALCLFRTPLGYVYRRVDWRGANTVALHPETGNGSPAVLRWPEDEGEWEVVARVDRVLKPL